MYWLEFFTGAVLIVFAGIRLTAYADKLSDRLQLGKVWIGVVLLGIVTSLPEAVATLTSVIYLQANDLAVGNIVGSNSFNLMLLVAMDIFYRRGSVTDIIHPNASHGVSAFFSVVLIGIVMADILWGSEIPQLQAGSLSLGSILIAAIYLIGMNKLASLSKGEVLVPASTARETSLTKIWINLFFSVMVVVGAAMWLAGSADRIAAATGLGQTFVGSVFLAVVTSLPELVVTLSALRLGAFDLAIGNIFGSNMTNVFILFVCDAAYRGASILGSVSRAHVLTAGVSIILTGIALAGLHFKNKKKVLCFGWDTILMTVVYILGTGLLYRAR